MSDTALFAWNPPVRPRAHGLPDDRRSASRGDVSMPSIRIPVTPENRTRLRALRAREIQEWTLDNAAEETGRSSFLTPPRPDREAHTILVLLAAAALAMALQTTSVAAAFVANWDRFQVLVRSLLP